MKFTQYLTRKNLFIFLASISFQLILFTIFKTFVEIYPIIFRDSIGYIELSKNFPLTENFRTPGYPFFVSIFQNLDLLVLAQIFLTALSSVVFYYFSLFILKKEKLAYFGVLWFVLSINVSFHSLLILSDSIFTNLLLVIVFLVCYVFNKSADLSRADLFKWGSLIGFLISLLTYIRPVGIYIPLLLLLLGGFLFLAKKVKFNIFYLTATILVVSAVFLSPWYLRNYNATGHLVFSSVPTHNMLFHNLREFSVSSFSSDSFKKEYAEIRKNYLPQNYLYLNTKNEVDAISLKLLKENFAKYLLFHIYTVNKFFISSSFQLFVTRLPESQHKRLGFDEGGVHFSRLIESKDFVGIMKKIYNLQPTGTDYIINIFCMLLLYGYTIYVFVFRKFDINMVILLGFIFYFAVATGPVASSRYRLAVDPLIMIVVIESISLILIKVRNYRNS